MASNIARPSLSFALGRVTGRPDVSVELQQSQLSTHMAIYGGTGKGKSKFIELMIRQIIDQGQGCCLIDPHGDLAEDILAYVMQTKDASSREVLDRIHYLEPGSSSTRFGFDPFQYSPPENGREDYDDWLKAKVESVARIIIRKQGESDFQGRPRLERFLSNVLYGVGMRLNDRGDHISLADAEILLDTSHRWHDDLFASVSAKLPSHVRSDFAKVHTSNPRQQEDWIESTIGRLRSFLSPAVKSIFGGSAQSVNFRRIIENRGILLVNLRRTRSFTQDPGNAIGGLVINEILEAAETASRVSRIPFYLIIDEASRFVGQDLLDAFGQFRKWNLSICLAIQDLSSLQNKDIDMTPKVLSQCGVHVCFQQKYPDDLELLSQVLGYPGIVFDPLVHEVDRFDGYEWVEVEESSHSVSSTKGSSRDKGTSSGTSTRLDRDGNPVVTDNRGTSSAEKENVSDGYSESTSVRHVPLSQHRTEVQPTGRLRESVDDQFHKIKQILRTLDRGQAMASIDGSPPFVLDVREVKTAFDKLMPEKRATLLEGYKEFLGRHHPYCFSTESQCSEDDRLARLLHTTKSITEPGMGTPPQKAPFL